MAYTDYMNLAVCCSRKAVKLNHSPTHLCSKLILSSQYLCNSLIASCNPVDEYQVGLIHMVPSLKTLFDACAVVSVRRS